METLEIRNLHVYVEEKEILKGVNLKVNKGETLALLGPNGHGKSTLLADIMGNPKYRVTEGEILLDGVNLLDLTIDARSKAGVFLAMQYPSEVPGVVNADFLKAAINAHREKPVKLFEFYRELESASKKMNISMDMAQRYLNEGFSGGEKKRNEILQMLLLKPSIAMLDEIDSGLDVDALVTVSKAIIEMQNSERAFLVVSHYARLYGLINPTRAAVMINGKIALDGGPELIERIDKDGYEWIQYELGISVKKEDAQMNTVSIGTCGIKDVLTKGGK